MAIQETYAKRVLQKSRIPGMGYVINPYTGCTHGCVYCYARFIKRFTGHSEPWGEFLDAKVNAPDILKFQLAKRREPLKETVFLCSVTDPYLPAEKQFGLTRSVLEVLLEYQVPISILTKSALVLRDLDLLQQFKHCSVGLSLMTTSDEAARRFEPRASTPSKRLDALRTLKQAGIRTYAFLSPYIPGISDIQQLVAVLDGIVNEIGVEAINTKGGNWSGVAQVLEAHYPNSQTESRQRARDDVYWDVLEQQARQYVENTSAEFMGFFRH